MQYRPMNKKKPTGTQAPTIPGISLGDVKKIDDENCRAINAALNTE